jgi:transposase
VIERNIKSLSDKEKYRVRQEKSIPVLKKLRVWLTANRPRVAKDSLTGIAMTYLDNQWDKLVVYCEHGQLRISNIMAENAVRPFVIGRKAWLFCDTPAGAHASGVHYSLIQTAKLHDIEPFDYLSRILKALPYADTVEKIEMLLPWNFKNGEFEKLIPYVH